MDNQWNSGNPQDPSKENGQPGHETPHVSPPAPAYTGFSPVVETGPAAPRKHSGLGIASFTLFAVMAVAFVALLIAMITQAAELLDIDYSEEMSPDELVANMENLPQLAVIGFLLIGTLIGNLVGLILGIVGLAQRNRKKVFAVLGTVLNGLVIGVLLILFVLGLVMSAAGA